MGPSATVKWGEIVTLLLLLDIQLFGNMKYSNVFVSGIPNGLLGRGL